MKLKNKIEKQEKKMLITYHAKATEKKDAVTFFSCVQDSMTDEIEPRLCGFGRIVDGATRLSNEKAKFKDEKQFRKFCRAIHSGKYFRVHMTKGGNCVTTKYKD